MKKSTIAYIIIVVVILIIAIISFSRPSSPVATPAQNAANETSAASGQNVSAAVSQTVKVSGAVSEYKNAELGFSVQYPVSWEVDTLDNGASLYIPIDQSQVSTVATLQGNITALPGKCSFPPVTTVQDRGTVKAGDQTLNMISMSNNVQGRVYFDRMFSLQKGNVCYIFLFTSIALSPSNKGLTGSNLTQAQNNNKAIVDTADSDFSNVVKSFAFIASPAGQDETVAAPAK